MKMWLRKMMARQIEMMKMTAAATSAITTGTITAAKRERVHEKAIPVKKKSSRMRSAASVNKEC